MFKNLFNSLFHGWFRKPDNTELAAALRLLHISIEQGDALLVESVLDEKGCDIDTPEEDGVPALIRAAFFGHTEIVVLLLDRKAFVDVRDSKADTALIIAAEKNHLEVARVLLQRGAQPDLQNELGETALHSASSMGYLPLVKLLLDYSSQKINAREQQDGRTALLNAVFENHRELVSLLLSHGADPNISTIFGTTPLMYAVEKCDTETVFQLLHEGALVNEIDFLFGETALMIAAEHGSKDVVKLLIDHKAQLDIKDKEGLSALDRAIHKGHKDVVALLASV